MLTEKEFGDIAKKYDVCKIKEKKDSYYQSNKFISISPKEKKSEIDLNITYLETHWMSGGTGGGSCWDDGEEDRHYGIEGDSEPEFTILDNFLLEVCPDITFLQYKKITPKITQSEWSENEYYGNSTDYTSKSIKLKDLYDVLCEFNLI